MTRADFIERKRLFEKRDSRFNTIFMVVFFAGMLGLWALFHWIPQFNGWIGAGLVVVFLIFCLSLLYFHSGGMNQAKHEGLVCGACGGGLLNDKGEYAISTGKCGHCGQNPFSEQELVMTGAITDFWVDTDWCLAHYLCIDLAPIFFEMRDEGWAASLRPADFTSMSAAETSSVLWAAAHGRGREAA